MNPEEFAISCKSEGSGVPEFEDCTIRGKCEYFGLPHFGDCHPW
jgi:hypothetical protein